MAYSLDFRELAVRMVREEGESQVSVAKRLKIALATLKAWLKREKLEADKPGPTTSHAINREELKALVEKEPDCYLDEYAEKLGSKRSTVAYNLKVLNISRKKNHAVQRKKRRRTQAI